MLKRNKHKDKRDYIFTVQKTVLFLFLAVIAIKLGMLGGEWLVNADMDFISKIDVINFKTTLNNSFPIIDTVYNSGNVSVSLAGEVKGLINKLFGFDLSSPLTILSSNSAIFYSYYMKDYQHKLARLEYPLDYGVEDISPPEGTNKEENELPQKEPISAITFEEEPDEIEFSEERIIRGDSGKIALYNETKHKIDIDGLLKEPLNLKFDKKGPKVLIVHTHTTEGYLKNIKEIGTSGIQNWSLNPQQSVVRVGEQLKQHLTKSYGIEVIHNGTIHDYPDYNASYSKSLNTVNKILKSYPSIKVVLDIHRDGLKDKKLRVVERINGTNAAQVMFVVGSDQRIGLSHPNWKENLKLALKLQKRLNEISPGLARPVNLSNNRYNQHVAIGALIIEIGGDGNTLEESLESTKYIAKAINDVINGK